MYGPITLTVGQPFKVSLPVDSNRIEIQNDSPNDVWVYFGNVAPTDLTNANNTWHRVIRRQHTSTVPVEGWSGASRYERSPNAIAAFQGTLFLLAVNPGGLPLAGTRSVRNQVYVTPYLPGDPAPVYAALATQVDVSSQARVISVPIVVSSVFIIPGVAISSSILGSFTIGAVTASQLTQQRASCYLYWLTAQLAGYGVGHADLNFTLQFYPGDGAGNVLTGATPVNVYYGDVTASLGTVTTGDTEFRSVEHFFPPQPYQVPVTWVGNIHTPIALWARVIMNSNSGTANLWAHIGVDMDNSNVVSSPGDVGNNALQSFGAGLGDPNIF